MCIGLAEIVSILTFVATSVGVYVVWRQTGRLSDQLFMQGFSEYTRRYQEIVLLFPEDINEQAYLIPDALVERGKIMRPMRAYFDLCYEEWLLHKEGLVRDGIWKIWRSGIVSAFSKPAFKQAWLILCKDTEFDKEFVDFVSSLINDRVSRGID